MDDTLIQTLPHLTDAQKIILKRGQIDNVSDAILMQPDQIARACNISTQEVEGIVDCILQSCVPEILPLEEICHIGTQMFTSGDQELDSILGGGVRTGMIWEIAGESAAGKSQLVLQLSLLVQIPPELGGLSGSTCYLTTSSNLPTNRILEIRHANPLLASTSCGLNDIHTLSALDVPSLIRVLSETLPAFIARKLNDDRPIKLLVIDALGELFHTSDKTTTQTLVERSQDIVDISFLLHALARKWDIAILVVNEVVDVFDDRTYALHGTDSGVLEYQEQRRWFARADSVPGEGTKEVALGLVWANQVNARILLSRTGRRRYLDESLLPKRARTENPDQPQAPSEYIDAPQATLIRRLSIIFSSVSPPASLDYIVTTAGVSSLPSDQPAAKGPRSTLPPLRPLEPDTLLPSSQLAPLDFGCLKDPMATSGHDEEDLWSSDPITAEEYQALVAIPEDAHAMFVASSQTEEHYIA